MFACVISWVLACVLGCIPEFEIHKHDRSVWLGIYSAEAARTDPDSLTHVFRNAMAECERRGWIVVGCITSNAVSAGSILNRHDGTTYRKAFASLSCGMHTSHLLMLDVLLVPDTEALPGASNPFKDWRAAVQKVHDISTFVNGNGKLKCRLRSVMELEQHKRTASLVPLTMDWSHFRSVGIMLARFLKIADSLMYLFRHGDGTLAFQALGPASDDTGARAMVMEFGEILQEGHLQDTVRHITAWLSPLHKFEGWADSMYESSFFEVCLQWEIMVKVQHV